MMNSRLSEDQIPRGLLWALRPRRWQAICFALLILTIPGISLAQETFLDDEDLDRSEEVEESPSESPNEEDSEVLPTDQESGPSEDTTPAEYAGISPLILNQEAIGIITELVNRNELIIDPGRIQTDSIKKGIKLIVFEHETSEILAYLEITKWQPAQRRLAAVIQYSVHPDLRKLVGKQVSIEANIVEEELLRFQKDLEIASIVRPGKPITYVKAVSKKAVRFDTRKLRKKRFKRGDRFLVIDRDHQVIVAELQFQRYPKKKSAIGQAQILSGLSLHANDLLHLPVIFADHVDKAAIKHQVDKETIQSYGKISAKNSITGSSVTLIGSPLSNPVAKIVIGFDITRNPLMDKLLSRETKNQTTLARIGLHLSPPATASQKYWNLLQFRYQQEAITPLKVKIKADSSVGTETVTLTSQLQALSLCFRGNLYQIALMPILCPLSHITMKEELTFSGNQISTSDSYVIESSGYGALLGLRYYGFYPFFLESMVNFSTKLKTTLQFAGTSDEAQRKRMSWMTQIGMFRRTSILAAGLSYKFAMQIGYLLDDIQTPETKSATGFDASMQSVSYGVEGGLGYEF